MRVRLILLLGLASTLAHASADFSVVDRIEAGSVVIDSRPLPECLNASLPGARCLPAADFLDAQGRLPSERDLLWLFGTAGLSGEESVLVIGDATGSRDFVAGLLYLAGQRRVQVLSAQFAPLLAARTDARPGRERGMTRTTIFTAPMRDHLWLVSQKEVAAAPAGNVILAPTPYAAISRFVRQLAESGQAARVGWGLAATHSRSPTR